MAKIDAGKIATYKGNFPLNVATKEGKTFVKTKGQELTAAELAAIPDNTFKSMVQSGDVAVADKPKATQTKEADK